MSLGSRLEHLAWKTAVGFPLSLAALGLAGGLLMWLAMPKAAAVTLVPTWRLAWHSLAWDDQYPTPPAGSYCDATLDAYRLQVGPVEVRYSCAH